MTMIRPSVPMYRICNGALYLFPAGFDPATARPSQRVEAWRVVPELVDAQDLDHWHPALVYWYPDEAFAPSEIIWLPEDWAPAA